MSTFPRRAAPWLIVILAAGCGPQPHFVEVAGRVLSDGRPLDEVVVTFVPTPQELDRFTSSAVTDEHGAFQLRCVDGHSGAVVGRHRVTLEDLLPYRAPRNDDPSPDAGPIVSRVPRSYNSVSETPLSLEIKPGQEELTLEVLP